MALKRINTFASIGGIIIIGGLVGLLDYIKKQEREKTLTPTNVIVEKVAEKEYRVFVGDTAPVFPAITGIYSFPAVQTGVSAEIDVNAWDNGKNAGIARLILYEDGQEISSIENHFLSVQIKHNNSGLHTYEAEAIDRGGNRARSQKIKIEFSGKPIDPPPIFSSILGTFVYREDGSLNINVSDRGDNKGLKEVLLYEDGNVVRRFAPDKADFSTSITLASLNQSGKHTYYVKAVDLGGNCSTSETIVLNYER